MGHQNVLQAGKVAKFNGLLQGIRTKIYTDLLVDAKHGSPADLLPLLPAGIFTYRTGTEWAGDTFGGAGSIEYQVIFHTYVPS
jgi:hypothetical protein